MENIKQIIEQAKREERERIIAMLAVNEGCCPMYCQYATCEICWRAYLEPQKKPEEVAEGVGE